MPRARACRRISSEPDVFGDRQQPRARRHLSPFAHGFPATLPDRQTARAQRADQLHAERHRLENLRQRSPRGSRSTRKSPSSELTEYQPGPARDGAPPANAIRPAGFHYDYTVDSWTVGATLALDYRINEQFTATAALRADSTNYDYDNHMIDGNSSDAGIPCGAAGCLYARPADRSDRFDNFSPGVTLSWRPNVQPHGVRQRVHRLSPARNHRAVPPAAPAVRGLARQREPRFAGGGLEIRERRVFGEYRALRHEERQRDPARNQRLQRRQRRDAPSRLRIRIAPQRHAHHCRAQWHLCPPRVCVLARHRGRRNHHRWQ